MSDLQRSLSKQQEDHQIQTLKESNQFLLRSSSTLAAVLYTWYTVTAVLVAAALAFIVYANNELGTINDIKSILGSKKKSTSEQKRKQYEWI